MAKLTNEQQQELDRLQALANEPEETLEVHVQDENGRTTRLTGDHASKWLAKLGLGDEPAGDGDKDAGDKDAGGDDDGDEPPAKKSPKWFS